MRKWKYTKHKLDIDIGGLLSSIWEALMYWVIYSNFPYNNMLALLFTIFHWFFLFFIHFSFFSQHFYCFSIFFFVSVFLFYASIYLACSTNGIVWFCQTHNEICNNKLDSVHLLSHHDIFHWTHHCYWKFTYCFCRKYQGKALLLVVVVVVWGDIDWYRGIVEHSVGV